MKILQLCYKMPYPLKDGGEYSLYNAARSLLMQPNTEIKVLAMNTMKNWIDPGLLPDDFIAKTNFECVEIDTKIKPVKMFLNLFSPKSYFIERYYSKKYENKIVGLLQNHSYDIIQLEHLYLCIYLKSIRTNFNGKIVLRAQNVEFKLWETYIRNSTNWLEKWFLGIASGRLKKFEIDQLSRLDGVINLTNNDRDIYKKFAPNIPLASIPIGFDQLLLKNYHSERQFEKQAIVYHLGSMDWRPNIQGVLWFINKVLPILIKLQPDVHIRLAGKKMPKIFYTHQGANLHIDGEIENAIQYQEDKAILIVPLLSGSGIRVKIIEALALGKSIISTTIGAQGIEYTNGENIMIADDPRSFAEAIVSCVSSVELRKKLSKNSIILAKTTYGLDNVGQQKISFYKQI